MQVFTRSTSSGDSRTYSDAPCGSSRGKTSESRFLIIARSHRRGPASAETLPAELHARLIVYGALTTLDNAEPVGVALVLQAPNREAVDALIEDERTRLGGFSEVEIHNWEFGGRR